MAIHYGPNAPTKFLNSNKRRIYRSAGGRYFVRNTEGKKQYGPKAAYHKGPRGRPSTVRASHNIPSAIRPIGLRKQKMKLTHNQHVNRLLNNLKANGQKFTKASKPRLVSLILKLQHPNAGPYYNYNNKKVLRNSEGKKATRRGLIENLKEIQEYKESYFNNV